MRGSCTLNGRRLQRVEQEPVSRKPRKLFGPAKPILISRNLKTEKCIGLKLRMNREPLFILKISWNKQLCDYKV